MKERILKLLSEPSTYAGLAGFLGGISLFGLGTELWTEIFGVVMAIAGIAGTIMLDNADK